METMQQFIKDNKLTMTCKPADSNPNMDGSDDMDHWRCAIQRAAGGFAHYVYFSMGRAHKGKQPELEDVLDCLASDAAGFENAQDFEDWASEYGYDEDSRAAERIYKTVEEESGAIKMFLGDEAYETLLWDTERL